MIFLKRGNDVSEFMFVLFCFGTGHSDGVAGRYRLQANVTENPEGSANSLEKAGGA